MIDWIRTPPTCFYLFILCGLALRYWLAKRRFRRRGIGGLPRFRSYPEALLTLFAERLLGWAATLAIAYGLMELLFLNT